MPRREARDHQFVPLSGRLAEFRIALEQEIEAAQRNESSSAIPLINGRRIAQIGGSYQYVFEVESLLNLPGDVPGDLLVPGSPPQEVVVVSVDGMTIVLSGPRDLGPIVPNARLQSNLAHLMRRLIERIEDLATRENPVGDRILGDSPITGFPDREVDPALNESQQDALAASLGRNATFIWGPPGTGKTQTIGAIGKKLYDRGRSLLLVSHTNTAVDQAILRIAEAIDPTELETGRVIRVGDPHDKRFEDERYREVLLKTHTDRRAALLAARRDDCQARRSGSASEVLRISRLIDMLEWAGEAERDIVTMSSELDAILELDAATDTARAQLGVLAGQSGRWARDAEAARLAKSRQVKVEKIERHMTELSKTLAAAARSLEAAQSRLASEESILFETTSVNRIIRRWRGLPKPEEQREEVERHRKANDAAQEKVDLATRRYLELSRKRDNLVADLEAFRRKHSASPDDVLAKAEEHARGVEELRGRIDQLVEDSKKRRASLEKVLARRLMALWELELSVAVEVDAQGMLAAIQRALGEISQLIEGEDLSTLRNLREALNAEICRLDAEIQSIDEALQRVEELVIADAMIVATTLTRAYLRDSIQSRRFDTIILDEASMAPIPAIWVAASVATSNAVVVGDFRQLPPIVLSEKDLPRKWLGRDVFQVSQVDGTDDPSSRRVDLLEQHRMHPKISVIPNTLVYESRLRDAAGMESIGEGDLSNWYRADWGNDQPVLLVDTGSVGAWVTSVARGARASRLNFLSATLCVDLARRMLREDRDPIADGDRRRILIACPYRPHASLLELLVREEGLTRDVLCGTAHSFQGSEADVVIFDLVNDEPHWRVAMFTPENDDGTRRLLNVALTRARRRLIVVGDFTYIKKLAKRAFVGRDLVPFLLERYPAVDARAVVPEGLAARAAKAQRTLTGGTVEADIDRLVVTQEDFYQVLMDDLDKARQRIVLYSAFITEERLSRLAPQLRAAVERGVRVYVVTKASSDRTKRDRPNYRRLEDALSGWGITVIHKRGMHEKLIFIDDEVTWVGSLNLLSFSNTQEIMERRRSSRVFADYAQKLMLEELLSAYGEGAPSCPICGNEVIAREGARDPFYWACVEEDCYRRSVGQPPLRDGMIVCANCDGPVEFGEWGGKPVWRCRGNRRHWQRVARTHLRLPNMRRLVPKRELKRLEKLLGEPASRAGENGQIALFGS